MPSPSSTGVHSSLVSSVRLVAEFQAALQRDDRAAIVEIARKLIAARANLGGQWHSLAMIAAVNGEVSLAREASDRYLESFAHDPTATYARMDLLAFIGAWDEMLELLRGWPANLPQPDSYCYSRGTAALFLGETREARHYLEEAVRRYPLVATPWLALNLLVDFAREPELADFVIASEDFMASAPPAQSGSYYYTLGKVHADRGDHARAVEAYARGAGLTKRDFPYDRERDRATAAEAVSGYDAERVSALARRQSEPTDRGILVMGLPRSGTTLVEQILTSHSAVSAGAEIYRLGLLAKDIRGVAYPALETYVSQGGAPQAAGLWRHWLDERFRSSGRVVDKTLTNSRFLGLAAGLLPEAPLIWLTRDPLDCAWSCYRTRFASDGAWSYDLADMAAHFRLEDELRSRWQDILRDRLLIVPYEALVAEPEPWIRRILGHCGLPEEPGAFEPHKNHRAVSTSSAMQVRQPINRKGIGAAEPYRDFLEPFSKAYSA